MQAPRECSVREFVGGAGESHRKHAERCYVTWNNNDKSGIKYDRKGRKSSFIKSFQIIKSSLVKQIPGFWWMWMASKKPRAGNSEAPSWSMPRLA